MVYRNDRRRRWAYVDSIRHYRHHFVQLYEARKSNGSRARILQIIKTHRPKSFLVINESVETLLIVAENNDTIQIYEYRGKSLGKILWEKKLFDTTRNCVQLSSIRPFMFTLNFSQGIEGFVHKDTIKMRFDKLYSFKLSRHAGLAERHYLAVIHENRLTILEAKMHGEKLNLTTLSDISKFCHLAACGKD